MSESARNPSEYDTSSFQGVRDALALAFYGTDFVDDADASGLPFSYDAQKDVVDARTRTKSDYDTARGTRVHVLEVSCDLREGSDRELQNMLFVTWEDGYVVLVDLDEEDMAEFVSLDEAASRPDKAKLTSMVISGLSAVTSILD